MLKKSYTKTGKSCRVTFKYPNEEHAESAVLAGDFNNWSLTSHVMKKLKDGSFSITLFLKADARYGFRYVLNGQTWVNDPAADDYVANEHGGDNSMVNI